MNFAPITLYGSPPKPVLFSHKQTATVSVNSGSTVIEEVGVWTVNMRGHDVRSERSESVQRASRAEEYQVQLDQLKLI